MNFALAREQHCGVHKTANVLDKMPKHIQPQAKDKLHQIWMANTRKEAEKAFDQFIEAAGSAKSTGPLLYQALGSANRNSRSIRI